MLCSCSDRQTTIVIPPPLCCAVLCCAVYAHCSSVLCDGGAVECTTQHCWAFAAGSAPASDSEHRGGFDVRDSAAIASLRVRYDGVVWPVLADCVGGSSSSSSSSSSSRGRGSSSSRGDNRRRSQAACSSVQQWYGEAAVWRGSGREDPRHRKEALQRAARDAAERVRR